MPPRRYWESPYDWGTTSNVSDTYVAPLTVTSNFSTVRPITFTNCQIYEPAENDPGAIDCSGIWAWASTSYHLQDYVIKAWSFDKGFLDDYGEGTVVVEKRNDDEPEPEDLDFSMFLEAGEEDYRRALGKGE